MDYGIHIEYKCFSKQTKEVIYTVSVGLDRAQKTSYWGLSWGINTDKLTPSKVKILSIRKFDSFEKLWNLASSKYNNT